MRRVRRRSFAAAVFGLALVINPGYFAGCAGGGETYQFGEAELLELVDEANGQGPFELTALGVRYRLELELTQEPGDDTDTSESAEAGSPAFARPAYACGTRTFMSSAAACISTSTLRLSASLRLHRLGGDGAELLLEQTLPGELTALGEVLRASQIVLSHGDTIVQLNRAEGSSFELVRLIAGADETRIIWVAR